MKKILLFILLFIPLLCGCETASVDVAYSSRVVVVDPFPHFEYFRHPIYGWGYWGYPREHYIPMPRIYHINPPHRNFIKPKPHPRPPLANPPHK